MPNEHQRTFLDEPEVKEVANNTVYLELMGSATIYSINYERRIGDFNLRIGAGGAAFEGDGYVIVPVGFNYMGIGNKSQHLELGVTANISYISNSETDEASVSISPLVGFREQPFGGGFNFRAGFSPIISLTGQGMLPNGFIPWPYASFGASF